MSARYQVEQTRVFRAPRALVWAIVCDTNRVDRAAGLAVPRYKWVRDEDRLIRHASATELGIELEWLEPPYRWIEGRFIETNRFFQKGPPKEGGLVVTLRDVPEGTEVHATLYVDGPFWVGWIQKPKFSRGLSRYFDAIQAVLDRGAAEVRESDEPAVVRARRLLATTHDAVAVGPRTPVDEDILAVRRESLARTPVDPAIAERLIAWIRERPDDDVAQLRPFELARQWEVDRRDVLRAFLHATQVGLVDLSWQINCPICRVGARLVDDLGALDGKSHCGACEIDYEIDFARHVEAVFPVSPSVRRVVPQLYCASSPAFLPHVLAQLRLVPGEVREDEMDLPRGALHLRTLWHRRTADLENERVPASMTVRVGDEHIHVEIEGEAARGAPTKVRCENASSREVVLLVERNAWSADAVLGTVIASMPEFTSLFATEAPAAGVELTVGHIALLFSDLTGSTALYEKVGDARAFAIVEDHFRLMERAIAEQGGAIVKTMGDAVMASFASAREAIAASFAMIAAHDAKYASMGLGVKIGVHAGPCLAVRANDRLDYFGTTVNVAARLQAQAKASEVVMTESLSRQPPVRALLEGMPRREFDAALKGIREEQKLVGIDAASLGAPSEPSGARDPEHEAARA
ncbi:adenylate/guanylate cyclase domain-containing protein [Sandaracinus amylolyticus]|uniref:adenylate/guanylate cyclase domain-containing protein n=1 Tax=Sandaracinus amylolyticus TaxID=927083 RepID=UPI001F264DD8|nr:adenylate/guanylate cyclase domain-containing protein [Sandaracinus amylolyticus]UJR81550.1 Adenylate cyclase [Sandaracinus amylolyticus]